MIDVIDKSREDQDIEFRTFIEPYATINCKECYGTGKAGWIKYLGDIKVDQYQVCTCVTNNIQKIRDAEEKPN